MTSLASGQLFSGTMYSDTLVIDGQTRRYQWFLPIKTQPAYPLVMILHGAFLTANQLINSAMGEWRSIADEAGWIVVYPDGLNLAWNDCRHDSAVNQDINDVAFLDAVITRLQAQQPINRQRLYLAGVSNGGMMALRMVQESRHPIAAVATILASLPANSECRPATDTPSWLLINSAEDQTIPWEGGYVSGRPAQGSVLPITTAVTQWAERLAIQGPAHWQTLPDINPADNSQVRWLHWQNPLTLKTIDLYILLDAGHVTPSIAYPVAAWVELLSGRQNRDIEPAQIMYDFFQQY